MGAGYTEYYNGINKTNVFHYFIFKDFILEESVAISCFLAALSVCDYRGTLSWSRLGGCASNERNSAELTQSSNLAVF